MTGGRERRSALVVGAGIAVAIVVVGLVLVRLGRPTSSEGGEGHPTGSVVTTASAGSQPSNAERGGASAAGRDERGAVDAAVAYTAASQRWLYLTDDEIVSAVAEIATPDATDRLAREVLEEVRTSRDELAAAPGRVWWLVHPLAWRVETYSSDEATVAVWTVTVLSASEVAVPQSAWMTVTVDLDWLGGAWHVDAVRDRPGPTPMTGPRDEPWDSQPFDDALDGFTRLTEEESA